jgi:hypothetical protein
MIYIVEVDVENFPYNSGQNSLLAHLLIRFICFEWLQSTATEAFAFVVRVSSLAVS